MDVFALRNRLVDDYKRYIESFVRIRDEKIEKYVRQEFESGALWPDPILQLNPAYELGPTLDELAARGALLADTARFFRRYDGGPLQLYQHQQEAIEAGQRGESYVVTTGTGSGKSLTYLVPIYDHVVRNAPEKEGVRAIIVYPMNALTNSQAIALDQYAVGFAGNKVRFAKYTGQEGDATRNRIQEHPPHILLTNYVMLEYMLLRPAERVFTDRIKANLEFLVLDELHTYRGRQGADIAMLMRRLREHAGNSKLVCIGTSATMATEGSREERRSEVARVASKLFGAEVKPINVVDETLRRAIRVAVPDKGEPLRAAVEAPVPSDEANFTKNGFAAWAEDCFGLKQEGDRLIRRPPITFTEGANAISKATTLAQALCESKLRDLLAAGNAIKCESGEPLFAFRLHQFLAAGGTVYATLQSATERKLSLEGQYYAAGGNGDTLLFPLVFCRECGQEYYMVNLHNGATPRFAPRTPVLYGEDQDLDVEPGYLALNRDADDTSDLWDDSRTVDLPDHWWEERKKGPRIKRDFKPYIPRAFTATPDGQAKANDSAGLKLWFLLSPFLVCPRCEIAYDRREKNDFRKLTRLSHTGRSTATTIVAGSAIVQLRSDADVSEQARKLLSFTDNRQDASLQAGHFNDFIQVVLVRAALYKALSESGSLDDATITPEVFKALALRQEVYAKAPSDVDPGKSRNELAMKRLLQYRIYEDLRRGWRVIQPNLEQCGLMEIEYPGLQELCENESAWQSHPVLAQAKPDRRYWAASAFLDHLRKEMAIDAKVLDPNEHWELRQRVQQSLRDPWAFDNDDVIRESTLFVVPNAAGRETPRDRNLSERARLGQFLRSRETWGISKAVDAADWEHFINALLNVLKGNFVLFTKTHTQRPAVQLLAAALRWKKGSGTPPPPDPIRTRWMHSEKDRKAERRANEFFSALYRETARLMAGIEGQAHTGQVRADLREYREGEFREGRLSALFCSPTMELGIDIRDLNMVHLRNIPPTPAKYAQRSGRAGRGGQPALVVAFCSEGSSHDQYFFRKPEAMVAGIVAPPRLELGNQELVKAHIHSVWLAATGIALRNSMADVLDLLAPNFPLNAQVALDIQLSSEKQAALREECQAILAACGEEVTNAVWYDAHWLEHTLREAPVEFDRAFDRWRELYSGAVRQRQSARDAADNHPDARQRQRAKALAAEADREVELLRNATNQPTESDFYPYRYLASEGFLPGYNFPRLPLRALLEGESTDIVDRPRFLGLSEFGPRNILYHEGRKYRLERCVLPIGGLETRLKRARFCLMCGFFHEDEAATKDLCDHCKTAFNGETSLYVPSLFEMTTVRGKRVERITCDEEERTREGYEIVTHYRFASGTDARPILQKAIASISGSEPILQMLYAPQADLWRVNRRWRRSDQKGFTLGITDGYWSRKPGEDGPKDVEEAQVKTGVQPFVRDTRNLLLVKPNIPTGDKREDFMASVSYALQRGMQVLFQVEEQEIVVERLGQKDNRRILFWEAAEGGNGIWTRLVDEPTALAQVAKEALRICHFDPDTGEDVAEKNTCSRACYRCLLSYSNQFDHPKLDRFLIRDYLLSFKTVVTTKSTAERSYDEQYTWLLERRDPSSSLERDFLKLLFETRRHLPQKAQFRPENGVYAEADFFYERDGLKGVAVFIDGPHHDEPARKKRDTGERSKLEDMGYRVIVIRFDTGLEEQIAASADVFGPGVKRAATQD